VLPPKYKGLDGETFTDSFAEPLVEGREEDSPTTFSKVLKTGIKRIK
jgi:hypothetical protein